MNVRVERTYSFSTGHRYLLTLPAGTQVHLAGSHWTTTLEAKARDKVHHLTGAMRGIIRFDHC